MQHFKRLTQDMGPIIIFAMVMAMAGISAAALTTFGKSPNPPPPPPASPAVKGRECNSHLDCASIQHTSCVKDLEDNKLRCLCGNNEAPINGFCGHTKKGLRHMCTDSLQCGDGMICGNDNSTRSTGFNRNSNSAAASKLCLCDDENGYKEDTEDNRCNDAMRITTGILVPIASLLLGILLSQK